MDILEGVISDPLAHFITPTSDEVEMLRLLYYKCPNIAAHTPDEPGHVIRVSEHGWDPKHTPTTHRWWNFKIIRQPSETEPGLAQGDPSILQHSCKHHSTNPWQIRFRFGDVHKTAWPNCF